MNFDSTKVYNEYGYYCICSPTFQCCMMKLSSGSTFLEISPKNLKGIAFHFPSLPEQKKIADFLSSIDEKISSFGTKLDLLKQYKKSVMQEILNQKIRFKADDGSDFPEWEEKKLEVFFDFFRAAVLSKEDIKETGKRPCIHYGQLFTRYGEVVRTVGFYSDKDGFLSKSGDILMPSSDVTPSGLAKASALMLDNVLLGGDINVLRSKKEVSSEFFAYIINFFKKKILVKVTGSSIKHIYIENIKNITYRIPSLPEQKKIADFLSSIDEKIDLTEKLLSALNQYKKGLMQQLFV